jgi:hypothetical protein
MKDSIKSTIRPVVCSSNSLCLAAIAVFYLIIATGIVLIPAAGPVLKVPADIEWKEKILVASGDVYQGPWRMNESEFHYVDDPAVAITDGGKTGIAWADQREQDLFFQLYNSGGEPILESPTNISQSPGIFSWLPRMTINPDDTDQIFILWQDIVFSGGSHGGEIFFSRSIDGGITFDEPVNLSNTKAGSR